MQDDDHPAKKRADDVHTCILCHLLRRRDTRASNCAAGIEVFQVNRTGKQSKARIGFNAPFDRSGVKNVTVMFPTKQTARATLRSSAAAPARLACPRFSNAQRIVQTSASIGTAWPPASNMVTRR